MTFLWCIIIPTICSRFMYICPRRWMVIEEVPAAVELVGSGVTSPLRAIKLVWQPT